MPQDIIRRITITVEAGYSTASELIEELAQNIGKDGQT